MRTWLLAGFLMCSLPAAALKTEVLEVSHDDSVYHVVVNVLIDAAPARVREVLLDTGKLLQLNPSIRSVRSRPEQDGQHVELELDECLLGVCRRLLQVQQVKAIGNEITALTLQVPGSGFKSGMAQWQLTEEGQGTRLIFTADTEPDVWLPPYVGPRVLMKQLREKTRTSLETLERLARE